MRRCLYGCLLLVLFLVGTARGAGTNEFPVVPAEAFFRAFNWANQAKSEFESKQEYTDRINASFKWFNQPVWVAAEGPVARLAYDAEKREATVGMPGDPSGLGRSKKKEDWFMVFSTNWFAGMAVMQNDLGSQFSATNYEGMADDFAFENFRQLPGRVRLEGEAMRLGLVFPIAPQKARAVSESNELGLVFLVRVESFEHAGMVMAGSPATFDSPIGISIRKRVLPAQLLGVRVMNRATGEVLGEWEGKRR